jgi:hypothetical protein
MSNALQNFSAEILSQEMVPALTALLPNIKASGIAIDFSNDIAGGGKTVKSSFVTGLTAQTYDDGYTSSGAASTAVNVTLGEPTYVQIELKPSEAVEFTVNKVRNEFAPAMATAVVEKMYADLFALVTETNLGGSAPKETVAGIANLARANAVSLAKKATKAKFKAAGRTLWLSADANAALLGDNTVAQQYSIGDASVIRSGVVGKLSGFDTFETNLLGASLWKTAQTLHGFAATAGAFGIATRRPEVALATSANVAVAVEPQTGFNFAVTTFWDPKDGKHYLRAEWIYGVTLANKNAIIPLVDTAA